MGRYIPKKYRIKKNQNLKLLYTVAGAVIVIAIIVLGYAYYFSDVDEGQNEISDILPIVEVLPEIDKPNVEEEPEPPIIEPTPPPPPKPPIPIEAPTDDPLVDFEIPDSEIDLKEDLSKPPPLIDDEEENEGFIFIPVEEMPEPIGGIGAIQRKIVYPEIARRAGVQGKVFVNAYVDEVGNVVKVELIKGIGAGCDEAAMDAVLATKFKPGKQRGKPVKVRVTVPIRFKLQ